MKGRRAALACGRCSTPPPPSRVWAWTRTWPSSPTAASPAPPGGASIGHVSPEAARGGPIGLVEEGDLIAIDIPAHSITLKVSDEELEARRAKWVCPEPRVKTGYLARYARMVSSADRGPSWSKQRDTNSPDAASAVSGLFLLCVPLIFRRGLR